MSVSPDEKYENRTERYEESCNSEPTSDVNNSKQSAICNTKDEQPSIQFIVIPFHFRITIRVLYFTPSAIFFYIFNHFVANQQRDAFGS